MVEGRTTSAKAGLSGLIPQTSHWCTNCWKSLWHQNTEYSSLLCMWLCSWRLDRVPMLAEKNWTTEPWKTDDGLGWWFMLYFTSYGHFSVSASLPWGSDGTKMHYGNKASQKRHSDVMSNALLWVQAFMGNLTWMHILLQTRWEDLFMVNEIPQFQWPSKI